MKIPKGFKIGVVAQNHEPAILLICNKCKAKHYYYGSALPMGRLICRFCILGKRVKKEKKVKRNPRMIKRNNK